VCTHRSPLPSSILTHIQGYRGYDLRNPRATTEDAIAKMPAATSAAIARCTSAHYNQLEGFPIFAAAVLVARAAGVDAGTVKALAWGVVALRVVYSWLYVTGASGFRARMRSLSWFGVFGLCMALYLLAAVQASD